MSMSRRATRVWTLCVLSGFVLGASAADTPAPADPRAEIAKKIPGAKVDDLKPSQIGRAHV